MTTKRKGILTLPSLPPVANASAFLQREAHSAAVPAEPPKLEYQVMIKLPKEWKQALKLKLATDPSEPSLQDIGYAAFKAYLKT